MEPLMRITAATVTTPAVTPGAKAQKGNSTAVSAVGEGDAPWRSNSKLILTHSTTLPNALSACAPDAPAAWAMPVAGAAGGGRGVIASGLSAPAKSLSCSAHATSLSPTPGRAALNNQLAAAGVLEAARRSIAPGSLFSGEKSICRCAVPAAEILRDVSDAGTKLLSASALTTCTPAEALLGVIGGAPHAASRTTDAGRGSSAAAFEGVWEISPFVSRSSSSSGAGRAQRAKAAHGAQRSPATHQSCDSAAAEQPQMRVSLTQDNRGFLNPGYSCDSSDRNSDDCDYSSGHADSDGSAAGAGRHDASSAAPSSRPGPVSVPWMQVRRDCSRASVPVVATSLSSVQKQSVLALFPLTAAEEQAARQVYDAYRAQQRKTGDHRTHASATQRRSQISMPVSPSALSRSTSVGVRELLRLLRRLYHRAQGMKAFSTQARATSPTKSANLIGVLRAFPSNEYLLDMAEACFGTRRFQTLMAAVAADGAAPVSVVVRNKDRGEPAISNLSQPQFSPSSGLTVGEALSFFCYLKSELASNALKQAKSRHPDQPARPRETTGDNGQDHSAKVPSLQPALGLQSSQRRWSASATISNASQQVFRRRSTLVRRHSRPPPFPIARIVPKRATAALIRPQKPRGWREGPRGRTALLPPPSPHLLISDSCKSDAAYKDDLIHTYVHRRAFAEISEGHGGQGSSTLTLERLMRVLHWFRLALNLSAAERVCGVQMQSACESHISIDFNVFVKIMNSGMHGQRCSEGSCSAFSPTPVSADNSNDLQPDMVVLRLLPEAPARAPPVLPLTPSLAEAEAASLGAGRGAEPCSQDAYCNGSVLENEGSNRSILAAASAASAAHRRQSSVSSVTTSTSSVASGTSVRRSSLDTDDAYPLVAHDSAIAVLCRSIRQRLRREQRRSVSSGSDALLPPRDDKSSGDWDANGAAPMERDCPWHSPLTQTAPAASYSSRSSSSVSAAAMFMPSGDVSAVGLFRESGSASTSHRSESSATPPNSSKRRIGTTYNNQLFHQTLRKQASQSPVVAPALPPRSHPYTLAPTLRDVLAQPDGSGEEATVSQRSASARHSRRRGHQRNGPPLADPATARRLFPSSGAAGWCRQQQPSALLFTSLSPYSSSDQDVQGYGGHRRLCSAALSALRRMRRSPSLQSCPDQSVLHTLLYADPDSSASLRLQPLPAQMTSRRPKLKRSGSPYTRPVAAPALGTCGAHVSQPPFSPSTRSSPLSWSTGVPPSTLKGLRLRSR